MKKVKAHRGFSMCFEKAEGAVGKHGDALWKRVFVEYDFRVMRGKKSSFIVKSCTNIKKNGRDLLRDKCKILGSGRAHIGNRFFEKRWDLAYIFYKFVGKSFVAYKSGRIEKRSSFCLYAVLFCNA